jgi:RNA polymerase sigma factor (sigma-70 family)
MAEHPLTTPEHVNYRAWLRRIARNLIIDQRRHGRREWLASTFGSEYDVPPPDWCDEGADEPGVRLDREEELAALRQCVESLEPDQRQLVELRAIQSQGYEVIEGRTGVSRGALRVRFLRIRRLLRECMEMKLAESPVGRLP